MKSTVAKYNALLVTMSLIVAALSIAFNYKLVYEDRLAGAKETLSGAVNHQITQHLREASTSNGPLSAMRLAEIIQESLHMPGVDAFGAVLDEDGKVVGGVGLTADLKPVLKDAMLAANHSLIETDRHVLLPIKTGTHRIVAGFGKDSIVRGVWAVTSNTALFVAVALVIYILLALTALRHWIVNPLIRFLESGLRGSIEGVVSGNPQAAAPQEGLKVLPHDISVNIERNMMALHTWARHKGNFDKFISITTAESNKRQLAANLHNILSLELPLKGLTVMEINHSLNRLVPIYESGDPDYGEDLLSDPQRCFVYRSGTRLVQTEGERICAVCHAKAGEVMICKPLMAAGKEMGVCRVLLDSERMTRDLSSSSYGNPVAVAEALLDTYIYFTSLSLSNLTLLDSYKNQAITDGLTGLYNRRYIVEYMANMLSVAKRGNKAFSVFMIDIDNFKRLNDEYGHNAGDQVLQRVAKTMRRSIRDCDIIARYGGEEFVVALPETDSAIAREVAERLREAVATIEWESVGLGNIPQVTVSLGIAEFPIHGYSHYHLTNAADKALYTAKRAGKNRVVVHQTLPGEVPSESLQAEETS